LDTSQSYKVVQYIGLQWQYANFYLKQMLKEYNMNIGHQFTIMPGTFNSSLREELVDGFGTWIKQYVKRGWTAYLCTFMFNQLPGSEQARIQQMHEEITTFYRKFVTRVVREPRLAKNADLLPSGVFFPDGVAYKRRKQALRDVTVNDGLHMHGVVVIPGNSRLKVSFDEHVGEHRSMYETQKMYRIDVMPIDPRIVYTTGYAGKALKTPRFMEDDVLILPQTSQELESGRRITMFKARQIRDIQARFNVSDDVARAAVARSKGVGWLA
jgi:hypothetical protein